MSLFSNINNIFLNGESAIRAIFNGIEIWSSSPVQVDLIREQLTEIQKVFYDQASIGDWIKVTSTEYNKIVNNVSGSTKKGNSDVQVNTREALTSYSNRHVTFGSLDVPSFQIDVGEYVIAMITETWNQPNGTSQLGYTTSFKGTPILNFGGSAGPSTGGTRDYYIRKSPTDIATETRYPTLFVTQSTNGVTGWSGFNSTDGGVTWTTNGAVPGPKIQIITTSIKSW